MTRKDFKETLDRVLVRNLEETCTSAELTNLSREIVAEVQIDWDPFEEEDPLDVGYEGDSDEEDALSDRDESETPVYDDDVDDD
jgi:hypothetical protein